jgi:hypothetical protein
MRLFHITLSIIILTLLFSCERREYTEKGILEIKKEIDSLLYHLEKEEHFDWGSAKAYSYFTTYFHNSKMIFINEEFHYRDRGEAFNLYYFNNGSMLYFIGREVDFTQGKRAKNIEMLVDPDGNVIGYDKIVNGQRTGLDSEESKFIIEHAKELKNIVERKFSQQ